ncbi:MAG: guanylate kinase [Lachnospiraceae bacterium]|nr:guanylate kinase [Lachnospiraceae bacterium]MBR6316748.1 guanylate kinase [Lachnospiraceae bacterium]
MNDKQGTLIVISGFSGAGKGTLIKKLVEDHDNYALSVSMTTRDPRPGEVDGVHYHFSKDEDFERLIEEGGLIEYAGYCGHYYGTPKAFVEEKLAEGKDVILEIEIQGAQKVRRQFPQAVLLFVMPPSGEELYRRLTSRGTETDEVIRKRMWRAIDESEGMDTYDYIVVNDDLDTCVQEVNSIVRAAHMRPAQNRELVDQIRKDLKDILKNG